MTKSLKVVLLASLCATFAIAATGVVLAANPADRDQDNVFTAITNWFKKGVKIGEQSTGGITQFNGTIINNTTDTNGNDQPVTVGDKLRVDDYIYRVEVGGTYPLKIADSMVPYRSASYSLGTSTYQWKDLYLSGDATIHGGVTQDRANFGTAKAAATVTSAAAVTRRVENIADGDYTASVSSAATGVYAVDFNFKVDDRYIVVTPHDAAAGVYPAATYSISDEIVTVSIVDTAAHGALVASGFDIIVY